MLSGDTIPKGHKTHSIRISGHVPRDWERAPGKQGLFLGEKLICNPLRILVEKMSLSGGPGSESIT